MKRKNIFVEAIYYVLHVIRIFFGLGSNYHMRYRKHRKLYQRLDKFFTIDQRSIEEPDISEEQVKKYPFPPNTTQ
jgi:uncharacterized protein (DUF2225 family)